MAGAAMYALQVRGGGSLPGWLPQKPRERRPAVKNPRRGPGECQANGAATTTAASSNPSRATKASRDTNGVSVEQFRTEGGLHLLFEPEAMDTWIPRKIATSEGGAYVDNETGELLSQEKTADYERYMQRLSDRFRTGEQADRLVRIVDQYMPRVADENRVFVIRHRNKVAGMLKKAWKIRNKLRQKQKDKKRRSRPTTSTAPELERNERREEDDGGATASRTAPARVTKASSDSEDTPPDRGGKCRTRR